MSFQKGALFASSTEHRLASNTTGARHGRPWLDEDYANLRRMFFEVNSLTYICKTLGRSAGGVVPKLKQMKLVYEGNDNMYHPNIYYAVDSSAETRVQPRSSEELYDLQQAETLNQIQEQTEMNNEVKVIEEITLINGQNATNLSDDDIFKLIGKLEEMAQSLCRIQNKPKKLVAKIDSINEDIKKLVDFVDAR